MKFLTGVPVTTTDMLLVAIFVMLVLIDFELRRARAGRDRPPPRLPRSDAPAAQAAPSRADAAAYATLLQECVERQALHEAEHAKAHPKAGQFTEALRVEAVARRLERKIHAAKLPPLSHADRLARAREALCRLAG